MGVLEETSESSFVNYSMTFGHSYEMAKGRQITKDGSETARRTLSRRIFDKRFVNHQIKIDID